MARGGNAKSWDYRFKILCMGDVVAREESIKLIKDEVWQWYKASLDKYYVRMLLLHDIYKLRLRESKCSHSRFTVRTMMNAMRFGNLMLHIGFSLWQVHKNEDKQIQRRLPKHN